MGDDGDDGECGDGDGDGDGDDGDDDDDKLQIISTSCRVAPVQAHTSQERTRW